MPHKLVESPNIRIMHDAPRDTELVKPLVGRPLGDPLAAQKGKKGSRLHTLATAEVQGVELVCGTFFCHLLKTTVNPSACEHGQRAVYLDGA